MNTKQKVAIIGLIGVVGAAMISQMPTIYEMWADRPIVMLTLGTSDDPPIDELIVGEEEYQFTIYGINRGSNEGNILPTITATNAKIRFNTIDEWTHSAETTFFVLEDGSYYQYPFYVQLESENVETFTLELTARQDINKHFLQQAKLDFPTKLLYEKQDEIYILKGHN